MYTYDRVTHRLHSLDVGVDLDAIGQQRAGSRVEATVEAVVLAYTPLLRREWREAGRLCDWRTCKLGGGG